MYYTIYKITNILNGKFYIGKHQTKNLDDGYMGSGKLIKASIKKHGIENFKKEILHVFDTEAEMNEVEAKLVTLDEGSYNLCPGGQGGFGHINKLGLNRKASKEELLNQLCLARKRLSELRNDENFMLEYRKKLSVACRGRPSSFKDKKHSQATLDKMKQSKAGQSLGAKNSQYGSMWITDGLINAKIKSVDFIPEGWYKGRTSR